MNRMFLKISGALLLALISLVQPVKAQSATDSLQSEIDEQMQDFYLVVAAKGTDYYPLRSQMMQLSKKCKLEVDTLDRMWYADEQRLALPKDSQDDIWAGEYYPRRGAGEFLSIEYEYWYSEEEDTHLLWLVTGMYETLAEAERQLKQVKKVAPEAEIRKAGVYMGCMH